MKKTILSLLSILIFSGCFNPDPNLALKETYWSLIQLQGEDIVDYEHQPRPHIVFHLNDNSLHGSDGCNRINALYSRNNNNFKVTKIVSTRMICKNGMKEANLFLTSLSKADEIKIEEDNLILFQADIEVARFEAIQSY